MVKIKISKDYPIQDWGVTYDEMEPYYDKAEKMMGVSGEDKSPFSGKKFLSKSSFGKNYYA